MDKNTLITFMNNGRSSDIETAGAVYDYLYCKAKNAKHTTQGIASSVFGQMNALLVRGGHLGFDRDERAEFNAWVGLPAPGTNKSNAANEASNVLAAFGL
jgi:hypothetical protein